MYLNYGQGSNVTVMLQVEGVSQEWTCIVLLYGGILDQWDFSRSAQPSPTFQFLLLFPHPFSLSLSFSSSLSPSLLSPFFLISIPSSLSPFLLLLLPLPPAPSLPPSFQELRLIFPNAQRLNCGNYVMDQLVDACRANNVTDLIIVHEHRGEPGRQSILSQLHIFSPAVTATTSERPTLVYRVILKQCSRLLDRASKGFFILRNYTNALKYFYFVRFFAHLK